MNILNKLTIKHLTMNKKRTLVTVFGVILSTALMVGIGLLFSTIRDYSIKETIQQSGSQHVIINNINKDNLEIFNNHNLIKSVNYSHSIGFAKFENNDNDFKPYFYIGAGNDGFLKKFKLVKGNLPSNSNEIIISEHINSNGKGNYKIGDTIKLEIGIREYEGEELTTNSELNYLEEDRKVVITEKFIPESQKEYKIVGIIERPFTESYSAAGYSIFTKSEKLTENELISTYIIYKSPKKVYDKTKKLLQNLGFEITSDNDLFMNPDVNFNTSLLGLHGQNQYSNYLHGMYGLIAIVLTLISVGCIVVIYNSFAISVMERKKQFGLFSSIGATKKQLQKTVFFEALLIGIIGIPLGLLSGFTGIGIVLKIINSLITGIFDANLVLSFYPTFIVIPILFMIIVVTISAFFPSRQASKISPIEAIRLNDDIKIKSKKIRSPKIVGLFFGIEGDIAYKNIKRNKKKYRITIISLFVSIVLFISFSSFLQYGEQGSSDMLETVDYDISSSISSKDKSLVDAITNNLREIDKDADIMYTTSLGYGIESLDSKYLHKNYKAILELEKNNEGSRYTEFERNPGLNIYRIDNRSYNKILKKLGLTKEQPLLLNSFNYISYSGSKRIQRTGKIFTNIDQLKFVLRYHGSNDEQIQIFYTIDNIAELDYIPFGLLSDSRYSFYPILILPEKTYDEVIENYMIETNSETSVHNHVINIKTKDTDKIMKGLMAFQDDTNLIDMYNYDVKESLKQERNLMMVIKLLLYGFISLVTLIGVTSVFNTINTSMALRRKEFAILRSIGLTPKGFNRILQFETIIFGLKSLFYAIPVSLGVIYLIHLSSSNIVTFSEILIPWKAILVAVVGVFIIISITMIYSTKKIKKENILESIREENI